MQSLSSFQQVIHRLIRTHLQQDVHVIDVFKKVLELAHIVMLQAPVNLNLRHQLLFSATLSQTCFLNQFASMKVLGLLIQKFIALCKPTFTQKFSLLVSSDAHLSIRQLYFFLDHGHRAIRSVHILN
jgi:hypothetical protein